MRSGLLLLATVHSVLIFDGMTSAELGKLSILHAFISPIVSPLTVGGDQTCVGNMRSMILYQLGMISTATISFDDFCSGDRGRSEVKDALKTDSSWITYQNHALQPCVDDFMLALADKVIAYRSAVCKLYSSNAAAAGKVFALLAIGILTLNF